MCDNGRGFLRKTNGRILSQLISKYKGRPVYFRVDLRRGKSDYVHVLVLKAFVGPKPNHDSQCRHGNGFNNKLGNREP